ncbi:hypothetical protein NGRA_0536 [Nosema granulosis]|uniref:DUF5094 domain-containing protein n=1 Tax=Nosema granulosis TaxID=83296 RepID=A0A9P6H050_9MICR|nr:hypothetical protein NGRA_0536 [Nosema granulosis]
MKTPRKRLTLKTPKRSTKTPLKMVKTNSTNSNNSTNNSNNSTNNSNNKTNNSKIFNSTATKHKDISTLLKDLESYENKLLEKYRKENQFLRSLSTNNVLKNLLGLDVKEVDNEYVVKYKVEDRSISFTLVPNEDMFIYKLGGCSNLDLPSFLSDEISFEKQQVNKFFFKVMEVMISKNV